PTGERSSSRNSRGQTGNKDSAQSYLRQSVRRCGGDASHTSSRVRNPLDVLNLTASVVSVEPLMVAIDAPLIIPPILRKFGISAGRDSYSRFAKFLRTNAAI